MALPELIEIVPLVRPVEAEITVPGSKSITNRALILGALSQGETILEGALWSEDTQVMVACLQTLGFEVRVALDPNEPCNRTIAVVGQGGSIPPGGSEQRPRELFVGNAGTAARFLAALVCLGSGIYRLHGVPRMHERPQAELFSALRQLGCRVEPEGGNDKLPALIGAGARDSGGPRRCAVSIEKSSQFASALLLGAKAGGWEVQVQGDNAEESAYVAMTRQMIQAFPEQGGRFQIEPDASSGSYFLAADRVMPAGQRAVGETAPARLPAVSVAHWPRSGWQIDQHFGEVLRREPGTPISRARDLGDSIMTAIVLAPFSSRPVRFTDLGRLRVQECERVAALRTELTRCGARVVEEGDTLTVFPSDLHGAGIETYDDHRMAMCFAVLGLRVPGMKLKNPACVKKTFPNFFQKLAAPPPGGLGVTILDARGRPLGMEDLFAE